MIAKYLFLVVLMMTTLYTVYVMPSIRLHTISDETFLKQFMKMQFNACTDASLLNTLSSRKGDMTLDYWYTFHYLSCSNYTFYSLFTTVNRFTDELHLCVYGVNHHTNQPFHHVIPFHKHEMSIQTDSHRAIVSKGNVFRISIDFHTNEFTYDLEVPEIKVHFRMKATDWTTNMGTFFPRYQPIRYITDLDAHSTKRDNEWMVDSPCTGKVVGGTIDGAPTGSGTMWFDTYSGTNYHYLDDYIWFLINTDDWLIYLLQYDSKTHPTAILIKNKRENRWFYSGVTNIPIMEPFGTIFRTLEPMSFTFKIDGEFGNNFVATFVSNDITITIRSKKNSIFPILIYPYYHSSEVDSSTLSAEDAAYHKKIRRLSFDEYACEGHVVVEYDGKKEEFDARMIYEIMHQV